MKKYRVVKETNNMDNPPSVTYVIEKHVKFLFWSWWSRHYLPDLIGYYSFSEKYLAFNTCSILNREKEWIEKEICLN